MTKTEPIDIGHSDIGRHVFTSISEIFTDTLEKWLESPDYEIDSEVVILLDEETGELGYTYIRSHRTGDLKNVRYSTLFLINENRYERFYETQDLAKLAAIESERSFAKMTLRACDKFEQHLKELANGT